MTNVNERYLKKQKQYRTATKKIADLTKANKKLEGALHTKTSDLQRSEENAKKYFEENFKLKEKLKEKTVVENTYQTIVHNLVHRPHEEEPATKRLCLPPWMIIDQTDSIFRRKKPTTMSIANSRLYDVYASSQLVTVQ